MRVVCLPMDLLTQADFIRKGETEMACRWCGAQIGTCDKSCPVHLEYVKPAEVTGKFQIQSDADYQYAYGHSRYDR